MHYERSSSTCDRSRLCFRRKNEYALSRLGNEAVFLIIQLYFLKFPQGVEFPRPPSARSVHFVWFA